MKCGYLGPIGTFSYEAVTRIISNSDQIEPYNNITNVIMALLHNEVDSCIVPIENSLQGCVTETIDTLITNENIYVVKEVILKVHHNLLVKNSCSLEAIEKVYSHPQALAQCSSFLSQRLPQAHLISLNSTATGALHDKYEDNVACLGNKSCASLYDLNVICSDVQDNNFNETRFWLLSRQPNCDKYNKVSLTFSTKHQPGSLYNILGIFNKYNLNLTKIESRPAKTILGEYLFIVDIEVDNDLIDDAIQEIKNMGIQIRELGRYIS